MAMVSVRELIEILDNYDEGSIPFRYLCDGGWRVTAVRMSWLRRKIILAAPTCTLWEWEPVWGGYRFLWIGGQYTWYQRFFISSYEYAIASVVDAARGY